MTSNSKTAKKFDPYKYIAKQLKSKKGDRKIHATYFCMVMDEAEKLFGPRIDPYPYIFAGIDFELDRPSVRRWGHGEMEHRRSKYIMVQLTRNSVSHNHLAIWHLAHECIHLLAPSRKQTNYFEEGLATWYQRRWVKKCSAAFPPQYKTKTYGISAAYGSYLDAYDLVNELMEHSETSVKRIRKIQPDMRKLTPKIIMKVCPWIEMSVAKDLVKSFPYKATKSIKDREY
jgi:hypothetical protein